MLIDTHAHLTSDRFADCLDEILARSVEGGVCRVVSIACDLDDSRAVASLAGERSEVLSVLGIHPCYVEGVRGEEDWVALGELIDSAPVAGIGETGLDYYHEPPEGFDQIAWRRLQAECFERQLDMARERSLPVVIHQRESGDDVLDILDNYREVRAVLHCFTGTIAQAERALEMGHYLSFTGVVTYPKAEDVREVAAMVPSDRFMVETDCPYLSPVPHRGKTNQPAYVTHTAARIAEVRQISLEEVSNLTTENACRFFNELQP